MSATTQEERETALKQFYYSEEMLLYEYNNAVDRLFDKDRSTQQAQSTISGNSTQSQPSWTSWTNNSTQTHTVTPGAYIAQHYDKELTFGSMFARALGATMPNGEERWLLINAKGEEVG